MNTTSKNDAPDAECGELGDTRHLVGEMEHFPDTPPQSKPTNRMFRRWEKRCPGLDRKNPSTWPRRVFGSDGKWYPVFPYQRFLSRVRPRLINARSQLRMAKRKAEESGFHEADLFLIDEIAREAYELRCWLWECFDAARAADQPSLARCEAESNPNEPRAAGQEGVADE